MSDLPAVGADAAAGGHAGLHRDRQRAAPPRSRQISDSSGLAHPTTSAECALGEVDLILDRWKDFLAGYHDPLITFGVSWLRRNVPANLSRVSLVQGDTGPVNFLFDGDRVTGVIDWEWGHLGDPMEDLGNICVREFWNPSGGLSGLFKQYEAMSGIPYDADAVRYYRVQQNVRGMIPIHAVTVHAHPREPVAWYLAYRYVGDRATCEALAAAAGVVVDPPALPAENTEADVLVDSARWAVAHDVTPAVSDAFAASRLNDVDILLQCLDRRRRYEAAIVAEEVEDLQPGCSGTVPPRSRPGWASSTTASRGTLEDAGVLRYLTRRALRDEWLWAPAVALYPKRQWAAID